MAENKEISNKSESALREERVLEFWKEKDIFNKSLKKPAPSGEFVFYDGPPTANGMPGIHHLEPRCFKDALPRYKTMRGYHVRRKGGWDTHGLPVELKVEKELGLKSKKEIEVYGIEAFNKKCKESVWKHIDVWEQFTDRTGYWIDKENPYVTYDKHFMESVWNVVKTVDDKKLLYKDYKVLPWCPRCGTALSSHELAQGYKDIKELSVFVKFKIIGEENTFVLAWTTTPWTLPGNVGLAVGEDINYVKVKQGEEFLILAEARLDVLVGEYEIVSKMKGKDLLGLEYEPLYPFLKDNISGAEKEKLGNAFKIYPADFVTTVDGTGVVHTAVMYGADDFELGTKIGLPKFHLVGEDGNFLKFAGFLAGKFVKDEETAVEIIKDLAHRGLLLKKEKYEHNYPHCWRCQTPLIYFARDSWYINMSSLREDLMKENEKINWEPAYIREGRFGEWLREVKDWAISRERYWGTPLPIWVCDLCTDRHIVGSIDDLKQKVIKSGNKYFVMRHGQSESNVKDNLHGVVCSRVEDIDHLTEQGKAQALQAVESLKDEKIDLVFVSPFMRTRETIEILKDKLGYKDEQIIFDKRLSEIDAGDFEGKNWNEYKNIFKDANERFFSAKHKGESLLDVKNRMMSFVYELEEKYKNKNILILSHGSPLWMLFAGACGYSGDESISMTGGSFRHSEEIEKGVFGSFKHFTNAEVRELSFVPLPHNENYELDLHRPFIDDVKLVCTHAKAGQVCGGEMKRVKEVMDVWFDSGAMPFAQDHYPFENKEWVEGAGYPADFISEAIDQTRGWFYTLLAVGVLMGRGTPYKNVICLGHILDKEGKKMSKSIGNVVDPWTAMDKYGVDTLRLWMYSVNQPGESKNFDERTVNETHRQVFGLLYNVLAFYELYRDTYLEQDVKDLKSGNILDQWILARLDELTTLVTEKMDNYKLLESVRAIKDFIDDLSTWYVRRSRDRIKEGDADAKQTLYFVLKNIAKLMAPFAPFSADDIWLKLKNEHDEESVHLSHWPVANEINFDVIANMAEIRKVVSLGLEARQKAGMKVRQPLAKIEVKEYKLGAPYSEVIKDELNVKEIVENSGLETEVSLDINITPELKEEGDYREFVRGVQDMRKKSGLTPSDVISLSIETSEEGKKLIEKFEVDLKKTVLASKIEFVTNEGEEIKVDVLAFKIKIQK